MRPLGKGEVNRDRSDSSNRSSLPRINGVNKDPKHNIYVEEVNLESQVKKVTKWGRQPNKSPTIDYGSSAYKNQLQKRL